ncbi:MAG: hypothetical protein Fur0034_00540 [Desulfuromonadia bacterium]
MDSKTGLAGGVKECGDDGGTVIAMIGMETNLAEPQYDSPGGTAELAQDGGNRESQPTRRLLRRHLGTST